MTLLVDRPGPPFLSPDPHEVRKPGPRQVPRPVTASGWSGVVLTMVLVFLTLAAAAGFHRVFTDQAWLFPMVVTGAGTHASAFLLRRTRLAPMAAMGACLGVVAALGVWSVGSIPTLHGFPDGSTLRVLGDQLARAKTEFPTVVAPVPTTPGFAVLVAWGTGLVAVLGDWGACRLRSAAQGLAPALALFLVTCVFAAPAGRTGSVALWVAAVVCFLLVHRMTAGDPGGSWFAGRRSRSARTAASVGLLLGTIAWAAATVVSPALPARDGRGVLGWSSGPAGAGGNRSVESPIVDLRTRILQESNTPVFTVISPVASYWRLTSLDTFNGTLWESTDTYQTFHTSLPGVSPTSAGVRRVVQNYHIQNLDSIWLPAAFNPEAISGGGEVTFDPASGSLLTNHATSNNLDYQVTSTEELATLDATKLRAAGRHQPASKASRYLVLPATVPASVIALAHHITAGATTEYDKALAIQNYLRSPLFTYSTSPPSDGYGISALSTFLLRTRIGYCQQFAGSYAVLSRIVGVPTRLAVGFATGTPDASGRYHVTDADAHTWPEVYFPRYGWVPFEPTKGSGFAIPGGDRYTGATGGAPATTTIPSSTPAPNHPTAAGPAVPRAAPLHKVSAAASSASGHSRASSFLTAVVVAAGATTAVVGLWVLGNLTLRRWRRARRRRSAGPGDGGRVLVAWQEVGERLAWRGLSRRPDETPAEYGTRAAIALATVLDRRTRTSQGLLSLADAVAQVSFGPPPLPPGTVEGAVVDASKVDKALRVGASTKLRARWLLDPRTPLR